MSYTKTAVSLPDELFKRLEAFAASEGSPRSAVVAQALARFFYDIETAELRCRVSEVAGLETDDDREQEAEWLRLGRRQAIKRIEAGDW